MRFSALTNERELLKLGRPQFHSVSTYPTIESKDSVATPLQLTGAALARRLNVSPSTLRHKKNARNFGQWTLSHDPDGIAWYFDGQQFVSVLPDIEGKPFE